MGSAASRWPEGWPRLPTATGPSHETQQARFVGGEVDGLLDYVVEITAGLLPPLVECLGSIYRLAEPKNGQLPEYQFWRPADSSESTAPASIRRPISFGRGRAAAMRDQAGRQRDFAASSRDQAGARRDQAADHRDEQAGQHEMAGERGPDIVAAAGSAAADRELARIDRGVGAADRIAAQCDRSSALSDRSAAAADRRFAASDGLTGLYSRQAGLIELESDLHRLARSGHQLVLAFVDLDHLKLVNDSHGHAAGDRMLVLVAQTLQLALRPHDLIIRYGGDEFLCAVQGMNLATAGPCFKRVNGLLQRRDTRCSVTMGLAQWQAGESAAALIGRADADLYRQRRQRPGWPTL